MECPDGGCAFEFTGTFRTGSFKCTSCGCNDNYMNRGAYECSKCMRVVCASYMTCGNTPAGKLIRQDTMLRLKKSGRHIVKTNAKPSFDFFKKAEAGYRKNVVFHVNGRRQELEGVQPHTRLAGWLREHLGLTGLQTGCGEGSCGACTVVLSKLGRSGKEVHRTVNACMYTVARCDGWNVTTVEGVGSKRKGYHPVQQRMAKVGGTQCGFCTPGFVNQMYGLLLNDAKPSAQDIEDNFSGNLCRCTGYRPILRAMQSFAKDADAGELGTLGGEYDAKAAEAAVPKEMREGGARTPFSTGTGFYAPTKLQDMIVLMRDFAKQHVPVQIQVGNTSTAVVPKYPPQVAEEKYKVFIDPTGIVELTSCSMTDEGVVIGSAVTITNMIVACEDALKRKPEKLASLPSMIRELKGVGSNQVRNSACWAGNLVVAHRHPDFVSTIATVLSVSNAKITFVKKDGEVVKSVPEYLKEGIRRDFIIKNVTIPFMTKKERVETFEVSAKNGNAHPIICAGFRFTMDDDEKVSDAHMFISGVGKGMLESSKGSAAVKDKPLISQTLKAALDGIGEDMKEMPAMHSDQEILYDTAFRRQTALNLFYKFFLSLQDALPERLKSAATRYQRALSKGTQVFKEDKKIGPVSLNIPKIEALQQCAGELLYTSDFPVERSALIAAPVLTTVPNGRITNIDTSAALKMPGVVDFISVDDIKKYGGYNECGFFAGDMCVFTNDEVQYNGQQIGIILAKSGRQARQGAGKVKVTYEKAAEPPILTISEAMKRNSLLDHTTGKAKEGGYPFGYPKEMTRGDVEQGFKDSDHVIEGEINCAGQDHWYMETQSCNVVPKDGDLLDVTVASQWPTYVRDGLCGITGMPSSNVHVTCNRAGGAFGGKLTMCLPMAGATAIAALKHGVPIRSRYNRKEDMKQTGKREPMKLIYKIGYNDDGSIVSLQMDFHMDGGCAFDFGPLSMWFTQRDSDNVYHIPNYKTTGTVYRTNLGNNTTMRAPGHATGIFFMEYMLELVAENTGVSPMTVREKAFIKENDVGPAPDNFKFTDVVLPQVWERLKRNSKADDKIREVEEFNKNNRWRKRGFCMNPLKYGLTWSWAKCTSIVGIGASDGSVNVSHSGCEIGQGMNTKVAQAVAHKLGIPLEKVHISTTSTDKIPNPQFTGGSTTSETVVQSAVIACETINERLKKWRERPELKDAAWEALVATAEGEGCNLSATGYFAPGEGWYYSYSAAAQVAELDVLTGAIELLSCDIVYDCGQSLNPNIDIGQIEGAYVQGLGLFLLEDLKYAANGRVINCTPWDYTLPGAKSIPIDFNVTLLEDTPYKQGVFGSKATGEPALILAGGAHLAARAAVKAARDEIEKDVGHTIDAPMTFVRAGKACEVTPDQLVLDE